MIIFRGAFLFSLSIFWYKLDCYIGFWLFQYCRFDKIECVGMDLLRNDKLGRVVRVELSQEVELSRGSSCHRGVELSRRSSFLWVELSQRSDCLVGRVVTRVVTTRHGQLDSQQNSTHETTRPLWQLDLRDKSTHVTTRPFMWQPGDLLFLPALWDKDWSSQIAVVLITQF